MSSLQILRKRKIQHGMFDRIHTIYLYYATLLRPMRVRKPTTNLTVLVGFCMPPHNTGMQHLAETCKKLQQLTTIRQGHQWRAHQNPNTIGAPTRSKQQKLGMPQTQTGQPNAGAATNDYPNADHSTTDATKTANLHTGQPDTSTTQTQTAPSSPNAPHAQQSQGPGEATGYGDNVEPDIKTKSPQISNI